MKDLICISDVVHYTFCPIFAYFDCILDLKQHEENRGTVIEGRKLHQKHEKNNRSYIQKKLIGKKHVGLELYSKKFDYVGKIDEAIEVEKEVILIERKYSDNIIIGDTMLVQIGLLAVLLNELINKPVNTCLIIFQKTKREEVTLHITDQMISFALEKLDEVKKMLIKPLIPNSNFDQRCLGCAYVKICPVGSLNMRL